MSNMNASSNDPYGLLSMQHKIQRLRRSARRSFLIAALIWLIPTIIFISTKQYMAAFMAFSACLSCVLAGAAQ